MVELVDSVDLGSTARACRFESCCPHQITKAPQRGAFVICKEDRTRTHFYASVRWTLAATSSKTGGYVYFLSPLRGKKMQIESCCPLLRSKIQTGSVIRFCEAKYKRVLLPAFCEAKYKRVLLSAFAKQIPEPAKQCHKVSCHCEPARTLVWNQREYLWVQSPS